MRLRVELVTLQYEKQLAALRRQLDMVRASAHSTTKEDPAHGATLHRVLYSKVVSR